MASIGNRYSPWPPYDPSDDCSHGFCTTYCRQFCYLIFPPPPPSSDDSHPTFSPLIIAIIALLASAFLLVGYYVFVRRYCRRRRSTVEIDENRNEFGQDLWRIASPPAGLDESVIKAIAVCKYRKGDGLIEGTECAVCLGEFRDGEALRLLPKCNHAFHAPCIDAWLKSQPNCPLCRAPVSSSSSSSSSSAITTAAVSSETSSDPMRSTNAYQIQRPDDLVLVVEDFNRTAMIHQDGDCTSNPDSGQLRRCVSLGDFSSQRKLLISDILKFNDIDECDLESRSSIGSSRWMKRSISAGRDV